MPRHYPTFLTFSLLHIIFITISCAVTCVFCGCNDIVEVDRIGSAYIAIDANIDATLHGPNGTVSIDNAPSSDMLSLTMEHTAGLHPNTWTPWTNYRPETQPLLPGHYNITAWLGDDEVEGQETPSFKAASHITTVSGQTMSAILIATPVNVGYSYSLAQNDTNINTPRLLLHTSGGEYIEVEQYKRYTFMRPKATEVFVDLAGHLFKIAEIKDVHSADLFILTLELTDGQDGIVANFQALGPLGASIEETITIPHTTLTASTPILSLEGVNDGGTVTVSEGTASETPLSLKYPNSVSNIWLDTNSPALHNLGLQAHTDLLSTDPQIQSALRCAGIDVTNTGSINFTDVSKHLRSGSTATLSIIAADGARQYTHPLSFTIAPTPVEITVVEASEIIAGINIGAVTVICEKEEVDNITVECRRDQKQDWTKCEIDAITELSEERTHQLSYKVPYEVTQSKLELRISYMGQPKTTTEVKCTSPRFALSVDAFALYAILRIDVDNPAMAKLIASKANIFVNGQPYPFVVRHPETASIILVGLQSSSTYRVAASMLQTLEPQNQSAQLSIQTESVQSLANSDFQDHAQVINYKRLPCGGKFSQSIAEIYNRQRFTNVQIDCPSYWHTTNAKTFCLNARNHNTWYMEPSVMSEIDNVAGLYSVKLQNVAWDIDGPAILPYRQHGTEYLDYNPNVPQIRYRAAGKLILGNYSYDPTTNTEYYGEGVPFNSRPSALNGTYMYMPTIASYNENGYVSIEVMGTVNNATTVIAHGEALLPAALTYATFNIPLTYSHFGVKATNLRIVISASNHSGSITYESANVKTVDDPITATSIGSKLWLSDIMLSYQ